MSPKPMGCSCQSYTSSASMSHEGLRSIESVNTIVSLYYEAYVLKRRQSHVLNIDEAFSKGNDSLLSVLILYCLHMIVLDSVLLLW